MVIFLYGPDSYRRQKKLNYYIEEYGRKHSNLSREIFDFDASAGSAQAEFLRLKEFSSQQLLFGDKKMAIIKNIFYGEQSRTIEAELKETELKEFFERHLKSQNFTILISEKSPPPKAFDFIVKNSYSAEEFGVLGGEKLKFFISKESRALGLSFTGRALDFLAGFFKGDSWALAMEMQKLANLENQPVDVDDLRAAGDYFPSLNIFSFINAVLKRWPLKQRLSALEEVFLNQEEPAKLFNILAAQSRLPDELIKELADCDALVKSGKMEYEEILLGLALK